MDPDSEDAPWGISAEAFQGTGPKRCSWKELVECRRARRGEGWRGGGDIMRLASSCSPSSQIWPKRFRSSLDALTTDHVLLMADLRKFPCHCWLWGEAMNVMLQPVCARIAPLTGCYQHEPQAPVDCPHPARVWRGIPIFSSSY